MVAEEGRLFDVESVDILLEQAKQGEVEGGESGLLALEFFLHYNVRFKPQIFAKCKWSLRYSEKAAKRRNMTLIYCLIY